LLFLRVQNKPFSAKTQNKVRGISVFRPKSIYFAKHKPTTHMKRQHVYATTLQAVRASKRFVQHTLPTALSLIGFLLLLPADGTAQRRGNAYRTGVPYEEIRLSDPCILADSATHTYYMTGTGGLMWTSKNLQTWDGPRNVIEIDTASWMGRRPQVWAAELHQYNGKYYYFATFTNNAIVIDSIHGRIPRRACHVLVSDRPDGPYRPMGQPVYLPAFKPTLDGTFWVEDGVPYMVYCHEWLQNGNGTIGTGQVLFRASDSPWSRNDEGTGPNVVTDGPWLFRTQTGRLGMLWTSWVGKVYTMGVAYSKSGTLDGPWVQEPKPITPPNYGHGMMFHDWRGRLLLVAHSHDDSSGHYVRIPHFFLMDDESDQLKVLANFKP